MVSGPLSRPETATSTEGSSELNLVAQVPFTLRSLNLEALPPSSPTTPSAHTDLDCWGGQDLFLSKIPKYTQLMLLKNLFFWLGDRQACSDSMGFPPNQYLCASSLRVSALQPFLWVPT